MLTANHGPNGSTQYYTRTCQSGQERQKIETVFTNKYCCETFHVHKKKLPEHIKPHLKTDKVFKNLPNLTKTLNVINEYLDHLEND